MSLHVCISSRRRGEILSSNGSYFDYALYAGKPPNTPHEHLRTPRRWTYHGATLFIPRTRLLAKDIESLVAVGDILAGRVAENASSLSIRSPQGIFPTLLVCDDYKPERINSGLILAPAMALVVMAAKSQNPAASAEALKSTELPEEDVYEPDLRTIYMGDKVLGMDGKLIEHYRRVFHDERPAPMVSDVL